MSLVGTSSHLFMIRALNSGSINTFNNAYLLRKEYLKQQDENWIKVFKKELNYCLYNVILKKDVTTHYGKACFDFIIAQKDIYFHPHTQFEPLYVALSYTIKSLEKRPENEALMKMISEKLFLEDPYFSQRIKTIGTKNTIFKNFIEPILFKDKLDLKLFKKSNSSQMKI